MSTRVHHSFMFSMGYVLIGIAHLRNQSLIIMLRFPEVPLLATRGMRCPALYKEFMPR